MTVMDRARRSNREAKKKARQATRHPALEAAARLGFLVRGAIFTTMGVLAVGMATGRSGATDPRGSLKLMTSLLGDPWERLVLIAIAVGLAGFALWYYLRTVVDPLGRTGEAKSWMHRLGFLARALAYSALLLFSLQLFLGIQGESEEQTLRRVISIALTNPLGPWLIAAAGLLSVAVGVVQIGRGVRRQAPQDLRKQEMAEEERVVAGNLGRIGSGARGVVFGVVGWFVVQSAIWRDPEQAKGIDSALATLATQTAGRFLLGLVGLGLVALGLYSAACARWLRRPV